MHWMLRPDAVIAGAWRALRPGGRFVGEFGGHGCVATIDTALRETLAAHGVDARGIVQWYFPTAEEYGARLEAGGFRARSVALFPRPTPLPGDVTDWIETFCVGLLAAAPAAARPAVLAEVRERLRPALQDAGGRWTADYVRLRFAADRP
jgi:hypothetical protein